MCRASRWLGIFTAPSTMIRAMIGTAEHQTLSWGTRATASCWPRKLLGWAPWFDQGTLFSTRSLLLRVATLHHPEPALLHLARVLYRSSWLLSLPRIMGYPCWPLKKPAWEGQSPFHEHSCPDSKSSPF